MNGCLRCLSKEHPNTACRATKRCFYCGNDRHCSRFCPKKFSQSPRQATVAAAPTPANEAKTIFLGSNCSRQTLPTRLGGLGSPSVLRLARQEYGISVSTTAPLTALILEQKSSLESVSQKQQQKTAAVRIKTANLQVFAQSVVDRLPPQGKQAVKVAKEERKHAENTENITDCPASLFRR